MPFPANFQLTDLDGTNGYVVPGPHPSAELGTAISSAGDLNGDGIDDFIVTAQGLNPYGNYLGGAYVVFGRSGLTSGPSLDLAGLNGTNGFRILGEQYLDQVGATAAGAGDINGDGIDDLMIGGPFAASGRGVVYVVFGRNTAADGDFAATLALGGLDGGNGYRILGADSSHRVGFAIGAAGDINGDGIGDMILGAPNGAYSGGSYSDGGAYVVFGRAGGGDIDLSTLDGSNGFYIPATGQAQQFGIAVNGIGDVNDDGIDDFAVGAWRGAHAYVVYGKAGGFSGELSLTGMTASDGFEIVGVNVQRLGGSLSAAGDFNNDGIDDFIIGAPGAFQNGRFINGAAFVVFGRADGSSGFGATLDLTTLDGTNGFMIAGVANFDGAGSMVARTADVNADGVDDILLTADGAPNGGYYGAAYVVFGRNGAGPALVDLAALDGSQGFAISGPLLASREIQHISAAGDVDGDGLADILVSSTVPGGYAGAAYVIYGFADGVISAGTVGADNTSGGAGRDSLSGGAGNDILHGLGGHDLLDGGDLSDQLFGGLGADTLLGGGGGDLLYGEEGDDALNGGDGADKLFGGDGQDSLTGGLGNDRIDGGLGADTMDGGDGNDYLDGGLGADAMTGGAGNDIYLVDDFGDKTIELSAGGYDIVRTSLDGWVLASEVEGLELQGSANIGGTGNAGANNLQGNAGDNVLYGLAGVDTINGGDGDDTLIGGEGNDLLRGGLGADVFVVTAPAGSLLETDQVYDFSAAEGDIIDLSQAFAGTISLVSGFSKQAGQMTLGFAGGTTTLKLDLNGDGKVDYQMKINGDVTGESGDWIL